MAVPTWIQALVLGVVQGLTEFIPISSSGHLVLVPHFLGWERPGLAFDVALHVGTAGAIITYFRAELWTMARGFVRPGGDPERLLYRRIGLLIALATVPVGVTGLALADRVEQVFATPAAAAALLFATAAILFGGEAWRARRVRRKPGRRIAEPAPAAGWSLPIGDDDEDPDGKTLPRIGPREALIIGAAQVLALLPGVSRSGTTIMAGVFAGMTRPAATRFAFLLALPALVGAGALNAPDLATTDVYTPAEIVLGVAAAFVSSYLAIRFLVALVARAPLTSFAVYCVLAASSALVGMSVLGG